MEISSLTAMFATVTSSLAGLSQKAPSATPVLACDPFPPVSPLAVEGDWLERSGKPCVIRGSGVTSAPSPNVSQPG